MLAGILLRVKFVDVLWALFAIIVIFGPVIFMIIMGILSPYEDNHDTSSDWSSSTWDDNEEAYKRDVEEKRSVLRSERKYLTDDEIREKHRYDWGSSKTEDVINKEDEPSWFDFWFG